jgi:hypothetical protein
MAYHHNEKRGESYSVSNYGVVAQRPSQPPYPISWMDRGKVVLSRGDHFRFGSVFI